MSRLRLAFAVLIVAGGCSSFSGNRNIAADAGSDGGGLPDAGAPSDAAPSSACAIERVVRGPAPVPAEDVSCGSIVTSLRTNANHCGACGHVCASGACNDGLCAPDKLFDLADAGLSGYLSIVGLHPNRFLLLANVGEADPVLWSLGRDQPPGLIQLTPPGTTGAVLRESVIWYVRAGWLRRMSTNGSDDRQLFPSGSFGFTVSDKEVFVAAPTTVLRASREAAGNAMPFRSETNAAEIMTDDAFVTFVTRDPSDDGGLLVRVRIADEDVRRAVLRRASGLAQDGTYVYVFDETTSELLRFEKGRLGQAETVARIDAPSHNYVRSIVVDDRYVHVALAADRSSLDAWIVRVPRCGGEAPLIVAKTLAYGPFHLENGAVIWGDADRQGWRLRP